MYLASKIVYHKYYKDLQLLFIFIIIRKIFL